MIRFHPDEINGTNISLGRLGRHNLPQLNPLRGNNNDS